MTAPADANRDLKRAAAAYERGDLSKAEKHCAAVLRAYPLDFNALHLMGVICGRLGRQAEALTYLDRAMDIRRGHPDLLRNRGSALVELGRVAEGLNDYDLALAIRPDHAPTLNDRGCALLLLDRNEEALGAFAKALTLDSSNAEYTDNLGRALALLERHEEALECYRDALSLNPDRFQSMIHASEALAALAHHAEALMLLDEALLQQPRSAAALSKRGVCLQELGRIEEALVAYASALIEKPDEVDTLLAYAECLKQGKRFVEHRQRLEQALALLGDPESFVDRQRPPAQITRKLLAQAYRDRGIVLLNLQRYTESRDDLQRALDLHPDLPDAAWNLGWGLLTLGEFEAVGRITKRDVG